MKKATIKITDLFIKSALGSYFLRFLFKMYEFFRYRRSLYDHKIVIEKLQHIFFDLTVKDGPMVGLKYPSFSSFGSSIFPKLAGSYERELEYIFRKIEKVDYQRIIDIGCAEGYYAIGLAKKYPKAKMMAFDTDEAARQLCKEMAELNNVQDQLVILEKCTAQLLNGIDTASKTLIICDCEGYENELFNSDNIKSLNNSDLIIELHPMYVRNIKSNLEELFSSSHNVEFVTSYDDNRKIFDLEEPYLSLSKLEKLKLIQEGRSFSMDWLVAISKQ